MRVLITPIILVAAAAASAILAAPAGAQQLSDSYTAAVPYGDLNLDSVAGRVAFSGRVKAQAGRVCGYQIATPLQESSDIRACRAEFARNAEQRIQLAQKPVSGILLAAR
jgi:UrcA family protein